MNTNATSNRTTESFKKLLSPWAAERAREWMGKYYVRQRRVTFYSVKNHSNARGSTKKAKNRHRDYKEALKAYSRQNEGESVPLIPGQGSAIATDQVASPLGLEKSPYLVESLHNIDSIDDNSQINLLVENYNHSREVMRDSAGASSAQLNQINNGASSAQSNQLNLNGAGSASSNQINNGADSAQLNKINLDGADSAQSNQINQNNIRKNRGHNGLSKREKYQIDYGFEIFIDRLFELNMDAIAVHTFTMPSIFTNGDKLELHHYLHLFYRENYICKRLNDELKILLKKWELPNFIIIKKEIQEKRWVELGQPTIHFHCAYLWNRLPRDSWETFIRRSEEIWQNILSHELKQYKKGTVDTTRACNHYANLPYWEEVKKKGKEAFNNKDNPLSQYFSKSSLGAYYSKDVDGETKLLEEIKNTALAGLFPRKWTSFPTEMKEEIEIRKQNDEIKFYCGYTTSQQIKNKLNDYKPVIVEPYEVRVETHPERPLAIVYPFDKNDGEVIFAIIKNLYEIISEDNSWLIRKYSKIWRKNYWEARCDAFMGLGSGIE